MPAVFFCPFDNKQGDCDRPQGRDSLGYRGVRRHWTPPDQERRLRRQRPLQVPHTTFVKTLETAVGSIGWEPIIAAPPPRPAPSGRVRGKGMAVIVKGTVTPSTSAAACKINEDGSLNAVVSTVEMGQGAETVMTQIAAQELGVPLEQVSVVLPDTDVTPFDLTTSSSRSTFSMGNALRLAVREAKRQLLEVAAPLLESNPENLEILDGRVRRRDDPDKNLTVGQVMGSPGGVKLGSIIGRGQFATEGGWTRTRGRASPVPSGQPPPHAARSRWTSRLE